MQGNIHSLESFGTVDGPGIRFVVFMQGCPLRCKYCHNPDTWTAGGKPYDENTLTKEVLKYKNYFGANGGVTVSGGEPLLQIDFIIAFFKKLKEYGIHTCVDTSGYMFDPNNAESVKKHEELIEVADLFLLDIKNIVSEKHKEITGKGNEHTLAFAKFLSEHGKKMWIRYVLVPELSDNDDEIQKLKEFIDTLATVEKIEVLPYHTMGINKYKNLGIPYPLEGVEPPTKERVLNARRILGEKA